jgi:chromosome segregation ATPase
MSSGVSGVSVDEFQALEQRVLRAVEIVKQEREARAAAEAEVRALREQLAAHEEAAQREQKAAEEQIGALNHERDAVRERVERLLKQMDELM